MTKEFDLFISYRATDFDYASELYERLTTAKFNVWLDKTRISPGFEWYGEIEKASESAGVVLACLTPAWKQSEWTRFETYGARRVLPLLIEGEWEEVATPPLRRIQFLDFRRRDESCWAQLFKKITQLLNLEHPEKKVRRILVPFGPNPFFIGRETLLLELHERLWRKPSKGATQFRAQALVGMPGVGKTTIAREYVERFSRPYQDVIWLDAMGTNEVLDSSEAILNEFARIAFELGLIRTRSLDVKVDARIAHRELSSRPPRLLILDNVFDEDSVAPWIPSSGGCQTIITTRQSNWSPLVDPLQVDVLDQEPATNLLLSRSGHQRSEKESADASKVAESLGYLPLALEQAAAFTKKMQISFAQYGDYLEKSGKNLLTQRVPGGTHYPKSVASTVLAAKHYLSSQAQRLLSAASFLAPNLVPNELAESLWLFIQECYPLDNTLKGNDSPAFAHRMVLAELAEFSLITLWEKTFTVHRLVQLIIRDYLDLDDRDKFLLINVSALNEHLPHAEQYESWDRYEQLLPHAIQTENLLDISVNQDAVSQRLQFNLATYMLRRSRLREAQRLAERLHKSILETANYRDTDLASCLNILGCIYLELSEYEQAEKYFFRAYGLQVAATGYYEKFVATILNNAAELYRRTNCLDHARPLYQQSIEILEQTTGTTHHDYAQGLNNLGLLEWASGNLEAAESYLQKGSDVVRSALGEKHPYYANSLHNLGRLNVDLKRFSLGLKLLKKACDIRKEVLGEDHPYYVQSIAGLAIAFSNEGQIEKAEKLLEEAIAISRRIFGASHPMVADYMNELASLYKSVGRLIEAEDLTRISLRIFKNNSSVESRRDYIITLKILADLCMKQGKGDEAEQLEKDFMRLIQEFEETHKII